MHHFDSVSSDSQIIFSVLIFEFWLFQIKYGIGSFHGPIAFWIIDIGFLFVSCLQF